MIVGEQIFLQGFRTGMRDRAERWLKERDLASGGEVAVSVPIRVQLVLDLLTFSPDGRRLLSVGQEDPPRGDRTLMVWDSRTGLRLREIRETHGRTRAVAFLPGRVRVASGGGDSTERDPATGRLASEPLIIWEFELSR